MPLYDLILMVKLSASKREVVDIIQGAARVVYAKKGLVTSVKSFGVVPLAYEFKKQDGRHTEVGLDTKPRGRRR